MVAALLVASTGGIWYHKTTTDEQQDIANITKFVADGKEKNGLQGASFVLASSDSGELQGDGDFLSSLKGIEERTNRLQESLQQYDVKTKNGENYKSLRQKELQEIKEAAIALKETMQNPNQKNEKNLERAMSEAANAHKVARLFFLSHTSQADPSNFK